MRSIAEHALRDYKDFETSPTASTCSYTPDPEDSLGVVNANAYRAFLLTSAAVDFSEEQYQKVAERNLNFVLEAQNPDGSWYYANDGQREFVDHFHTCFVLKASPKSNGLPAIPGVLRRSNAASGITSETYLMNEVCPNPFRARLD